MRNIKLTVAYDGTSYHGFQEQRGTSFSTIQETLEKCLGDLAGSRIQVIGAGRTDAGVHALGQVVNFNAARWPIPVQRIPIAMNGRLPQDIVVTEAREVPGEFHARFSARSKIYRYRVWNEPVPSPFHSRYCYFVKPPLDLEAMTMAAGYLVGEHDFKSFQAAGSTTKTTVRILWQAHVVRDGPEVHFVFRGNGFLYNMVRIMVGTLLQVGVGKIEPHRVQQVMQARDRVLAGPTAPPQGLCLEQVEY